MQNVTYKITAILTLCLSQIRGVLGKKIQCLFTLKITYSLKFYCVRLLVKVTGGYIYFNVTYILTACSYASVSTR